MGTLRGDGHNQTPTAAIEFVWTPCTHRLKVCSCVSSTLAPCKSHIVKLLQHLIFLIVSTGKRMTPTWTRLSTTASAGSSSITLNEAVNWPVGAKIVIPTTSDRHSQRENEMATIASVSNGGMTLGLVQPLEYEHVCVSEVCTQMILTEKFVISIMVHFTLPE